MALTKAIMTGASKEYIGEGFTKLNQLIDDLASTSNGLGASCSGVEDAGENFTSTNVEGCLAELADSISPSALISSTFNEKASTTTGLTWGYYGGLFGVDSTVYTVSDGTLLLTDDVVNYIEMSTSGVLSKNTSAFTRGKFPVRQVTCASGVQTVSTDKRCFARFSFSQPVTSIKTQEDSPYTVTAADLLGNTIFLNTGATGACDLQLPAGTAGDRVGLYVAAAQTFGFTTDGSEQFRFGTTIGAAGGTCTGNTVGTLFFIYFIGGYWQIEYRSGIITVSE